jgi:hypothetical protein
MTTLDRLRLLQQNLQRSNYWITPAENLFWCRLLLMNAETVAINFVKKRAGLVK